MKVMTCLNPLHTALAVTGVVTFADPELCKRIAANAERDIPVYSWREIAEQFEKFFVEILLR